MRPCAAPPLNEAPTPPLPLYCCSLIIICISLLGIGGVALLISVFTFSTSVTQLLQKVEVVEVEHQTWS